MRSESSSYLKKKKNQYEIENDILEKTRKLFSAKTLGTYEGMINLSRFPSEITKAAQFGYGKSWEIRKLTA